MSIVVTGATGFLGKKVVEELISRGHKLRLLVRGLDNCSEFLSHPSIEVVVCGDIFNITSSRLAELLMGASDLVRLAWYVHHDDYISSEINIGCMEGTIRLAKAFSEAGGSSFTGVGTCMEYLDKENSLSTSALLDPKNLYGACKVATFHVLKNYFQANGVTFSWCRVFYLYGEGEDSRRLVPSLYKSMLENKSFEIMDGSKIVDYLNVKDAAKQISDTVLDRSNCIVNICSGKPITIREFVEKIVNEHGCANLLKYKNAASSNG